MVEHLVHIHPRSLPFLQTFLYEIFSLLADLNSGREPHLHLIVEFTFVKGLNNLFVEGSGFEKHFVDDDAEWPDIDFLAIEVVIQLLRT